MDAPPRLFLTADVGGTNARLQLWAATDDAAEGAALLFRETYRPSGFVGLVNVIKYFLLDASNTTSMNERIVPTHAVLAVCGPTWERGRFNESNNIPAWCSNGAAVSFHDAREIERALGWPHDVLTFINDFEAIGHCIAAHLDPTSPLSTRPFPPPRALHEPCGESAGDIGDAPAACIGAGTGLGAVVIAPTGDAAMGQGSAPFVVLPSEAGMTESICPRNEVEWRLLQFLRRSNCSCPEAGASSAYVEVERVVSGPGIVDLLEFIESENGAVGNLGGSEFVAPIPRLSQDAANAIAASNVKDRPAVIAQFGRDAGEPRCLAAIDAFLGFYGRVLGSAAMTFCSRRGLFIAGGILPKLAWRAPCLGVNYSATLVPGVRQDVLLDGYLQQGPKMSGLVSRVPLLLVDDADAGIKGCLLVALRRKALSQLMPRVTPQC